VEFCVLIGVVLSALLTVRRAGRMHLTEFTVTPDNAIRERLPDDFPCNRLLLYGLEGELFFGASGALERHFERIEQRIDEHTRVVVLRMKRARNADAVGMVLLEGFIDRMHARKVQVLLSGVRPELAGKIAKTGLGDRMSHNIFHEEKVRLMSTMQAISHAYRLIGDPCARCHRRYSRKGHPRLYRAI
jgi:SulP family sulfate permease